MAEYDSDDAGVPLIEDLSDSPAPQTKLNKRKRSDTGNSKEDEDERKARRKQQRKDKKPRDIDDGNLDANLGVNHAIAHMDSRLMADHLAQRVRRFRPELSLVEAEDLHIPETAIRNTTTWDQSRTTDQLPAFIERFMGPKRKRKGGPKLSEASDTPGAPHTLVVAGAGLRAADLTRVLRKYQTKEAMVAKLFAKHIKLQEAVDTAKTTRMNLGVGTPQRLIDLLDDGALSASQIERIIVDASHIDVKKRGILDMKETLVPLMQLLARSELKEVYGFGKLDLIFF